MIAWLLSKLFPPRMPGRVREWEERVVLARIEQGWAGNVQRKYTGIERHWMEVDKQRKFKGSHKQWQAQLEYAAETIAIFERALIAQGYVNTIHDCWEKEEKGNYIVNSRKKEEDL